MPPGRRPRYSDREIKKLGLDPAEIRRRSPRMQLYLVAAARAAKALDSDPGCASFPRSTAVMRALGQLDRPALMLDVARACITEAQPHAPSPAAATAAIRRARGLPPKVLAGTTPPTRQELDRERTVAELEKWIAGYRSKHVDRGPADVDVMKDALKVVFQRFAAEKAERAKLLAAHRRKWEEEDRDGL